MLSREGGGGGGSGPEVQLEAGLIWPHFGNLGHLSLSLGNLGHTCKPISILEIHFSGAKL